MFKLQEVFWKGMHLPFLFLLCCIYVETEALEAILFHDIASLKMESKHGKACNLRVALSQCSWLVNVFHLIPCIEFLFLSETKEILTQRKRFWERGLDTMRQRKSPGPIKKENLRFWEDEVLKGLYLTFYYKKTKRNI